MSTEEVRYSVLLAFENLTEQSGSAAFRYMGQTTRQQMPLPPNPPANPDVGTLPACQSANIDYNLVSVLQTGPGGIGVYHARCRPHSTASGTKFEIHTYRNNTNWAIGSASTGWDLVHNWLHEGLHSLNLPHPTSNTMGASVQTSGNLGANGNNLGRDLYEYDLKCIEEKTSLRNGTQSYRVHQNGNFGSAQTLSTFGSNGGISLTKNSSIPGTFHPTTAYRWAGVGIWHPPNTPFFWGAKIVDNEPQNTVGWRPTVWREEETRDRIHYSFWRDDIPSSTFGKHEIRESSSINGFSTHTNSPLYQCAFMTGWMTCGGLVKLYSSKKVATAWDTFVDRTQFAWVNQNRQGNSSSREIYISTGQTATGHLPTPFKTGFQTHVSPGLACGAPYSAGGYDCLLAYVPQDDTVGTIMIRRFYSGSSANKYSLVFDPSGYGVSNVFRTASAIALWYHNSKYWIAFRTTLAGQPNIVWSSSDGASWTFETLGDYSEVGPSAVSFMQTGNNYLSVWQ